MDSFCLAMNLLDYTDAFVPQKKLTWERHILGPPLGQAQGCQQKETGFATRGEQLLESLQEVGQMVVEMVLRRRKRLALRIEVSGGSVLVAQSLADLAMVLVAAAIASCSD